MMTVRLTWEREYDDTYHGRCVVGEDDKRLEFYVNVRSTSGDGIPGFGLVVSCNGCLVHHSEHFSVEGAKMAAFHAVSTALWLREGVVAPTVQDAQADARLQTVAAIVALLKAREDDWQEVLGNVCKVALEGNVLKPKGT